MVALVTHGLTNAVLDGAHPLAASQPWSCSAHKLSSRAFACPYAGGFPGHRALTAGLANGESWRARSLGVCKPSLAWPQCLAAKCREHKPRLLDAPHLLIKHTPVCSHADFCLL